MPDPTNTNQNPPAQAGQQPAAQPAAPIETFDAYLEQHADVKPLYDAHTAGLKSALESERAANKAAQAQLRELAKKAEKGSELETALTKQADQLSQLEKQSGFYDKAHAAGVRNLKLAYLAAAQAGMVSDRGECDFAKLRTEYPELFVSPPAPVNAGAGTGGQQPTFSMDALIRQKAGR